MHIEAHNYAENNSAEAKDELHRSSVRHSRSNRARYSSAGHWSGVPLATTAASSSISYVCAETRERKCADLDQRREEKEEGIQSESLEWQAPQFGYGQYGKVRHVKDDHCADLTGRRTYLLTESASDGCSHPV
jgi:hypothetical protein